MSFMQQAANLNTAGVKILSQDRKYDEAAKAMTESIKLMKKVLSTTMATDEWEQGEGWDGVSSAGIEICDMVFDDMGESNEHIVFNKAILFSYRDDDHFASSEQDIDIYCAAAIYNIALVYHHQAVQCGHDSKIGRGSAAMTARLVVAVLSSLKSFTKLSSSCSPVGLSRFVNVDGHWCFYSSPVATTLLSFGFNCCATTKVPVNV